MARRLVGSPVSVPTVAPAEEPDVTDTGLRAVAQRAITNYLAGERTNLLADLARTLNAAELPVLLDLTEACRSARPPSVRCAGTPGSSKTMLLQYRSPPFRAPGRRHRPKRGSPLDRLT